MRRRGKWFAVAVMSGLMGACSRGKRETPKSDVPTATSFALTATEGGTPAPAPAPAPEGWLDSNQGFDDASDTMGLAVLDGAVYASIKLRTGTTSTTSGLYKWSGAAWTKLAPTPNKYGIGPLVAGPDKRIYTAYAQTLIPFNGSGWDAPLLVNKGAYKEVVLAPGTNAVNHATVAGRDIYLGGLCKFADGTGENCVFAYNVDTRQWRHTAPKSGLPTTPYGMNSLHVAADGSIFAGFTWETRDNFEKVFKPAHLHLDTFTMTAEYLKQTKGAVFRYNGTSWEDVTLGLDMRNMLGNCCGSFGGVAARLDGSAVYASTEQGVFKFDETRTGAERWQMAYGNWGNTGLHPLEGGGILLDYSKSEVVDFVTGTKFVKMHRRTTSGCNMNGPRRSVVTPDGGKTLFGFMEYAGADKACPSGIYRTSVDSPGWINGDFNLSLKVGTYLGGDGADSAVSAVISPRRELVLAANLSDATSFPGAVKSLSSTSRSPVAGIVSRFSAAQGEVISSAKFDGRISDLDVSSTSGKIAVIGDFGTRLMDAEGQTVLWSNDESVVTTVTPSTSEAEPEWDSRVAVASDDTVAVLFQKKVTLFDSSGRKLGERVIGHTYVKDVAVSSEHGLVYVTGFDNKRNGSPVQVAFLEAFKIPSLEPVWKTWGYDASLLSSNMADTRGYRLSFGLDKRLYFLGESAGGNTVFRYNGRDLATNRLITFDIYNNPFNSGSAHMLYFARIDPLTGEVSAGQFAIPRNSAKGNISNTFRAKNGSISADERGQVYIGGTAAYKIAGRDAALINGERLGIYAGDATVLIVNSDMRGRKLWTSFNKDRGSGTVNSVAAGFGYVAAFGTTTAGKMFTQSAFKPEPSATQSLSVPDAYLAIWDQ